VTAAVQRRAVGALAVPTAADLVAVVGCHGGAGTSTVTRLLQPALAAMDLALVLNTWPRYADRWAPYPLLLVTRGTARGTAGRRRGRTDPRRPRRGPIEGERLSTVTTIQAAGLAKPAVPNPPRRPLRAWSTRRTW
jgi:hypothetical protein